MKVSTHTIFAVPDGEGKYVVKFVYSPISKNTTDDPLLALSQHIFPQDENVRTLDGQSIVTGRGSKTMFGGMVIHGSWNAYGSAHQGLGAGVQQVRVSNPNGKRDEIALRLYQAHANQISSNNHSLSLGHGSSPPPYSIKIDGDLHSRLHIPAGILRIPVFSVPVTCF